MKILVNGEEQRLETGANVQNLIEHLGLAHKRIAIERNREIIPKSLYGQTLLSEGDSLEVVVAVGGG
ncbi:MAG: sulfur carrier protein ThiS [Burkholderiales bacterium]|jgi:sulfur carrier protein|nr:sulfur carrier protein ThiS [Burkholderiales bacterium]